MTSAHQPETKLDEFSDKDDAEWIAMTSTDRDVLKDLATHQDIKVLRRVAANPYTPKRVLTSFTKTYNRVLWMWLAKNDKCPPSVMDKLLQAPSIAVRREAATQAFKLKATATWERARSVDRASTTASELQQFAEDEDDYVRECVAGHPNTPAATLSVLATDKNKNVRRYVARNPNTPFTTLHTLATDKSEDVRECLITNPSLPIELLAELVLDEDWLVRWKAEKHPKYKTALNLAFLNRGIEQEMIDTMPENWLLRLVGIQD